jgi:Lower baseplate protein N-terminal domain
MANKKVSQLTSKPSVLTTDLFPIADPSTGQLYKTTISDLGTAIGSGVSSVNGLVGAVVLDTDDIQELVSPTNKWFTDTRARAAISAGTGISYNSGTGVITNAVTSGQIATALGYTPADDSLVVKLAGSQTITGVKTFDAIQRFNFGLSVKSVGGANQGIFGNDNGFNLGVNAYTHSLLFPNSGGYNYTLPATTGTIALTSDLSAYALDSAVVKLTGNQTVAGQKTFSSTLYGAGAVFSNAMVAQSLNITGITASPSVYITTNGTNHAVSIVQSGSGYAIYASGNVAVIGTGYFSSSLTAASLASTSGYNYTLPSASGTLALTSQLSSYLPLSGGTLTGALSGTSATFSTSDLNTVFVSNPDTTGATTGSGLGFKAYNGTSVTQSGGIFLTSNTWSFGTYSANQLSIGSDGTGGLALRSANSAPISFFTGGTSAGISNLKMIIDSSGRVGIGTTTLSGTGSNLQIEQYGTPNIVAIRRADNSNTGSARILFQAYSATPILQNTGIIEAGLDNSATLGYLALSAGTPSSAHLTIKSTGNVGIGTTSPTGQLSIKNQVSNGANPITSYAATSGVDGQNFFNGYYASNSDGGTYPRYLDIVSVGSPDGSSGGSNMRFFTNPVTNNSPAVERIRINSYGNLLVGTTADNASKLRVAGNISIGSTTSGLIRSYYARQSGNNITFDVFRWLSDTGSVIGTGSLVGSLYLSFIDITTGGNQITYEYRIMSGGNGTTNATLTQVAYQLRGTQPITSVQIVNDGGAGGIKVQGTVVSSGVSGCDVYGTFIGTVIG